MNLHVRQQGSKFSFRLRLSNGYIDAGETYETEESASFAADLAKHYLREFFFITKNTEPSLEGDLFSALAYRHNVVLSDRLSVLAFLSPGVKEYISNHHAALELHAESNRPERKEWESFRASPLFTSSPAIREWVLKCERAEQDANDFSEIDSRSFFTRLEVAHTAMGTALRSLGVAQRMHEGVTNPRLVERARIIYELRDHLAATEAHIKFLAGQFDDEQEAIKIELARLESTRPPLV